MADKNYNKEIKKINSEIENNLFEFNKKNDHDEKINGLLNSLNNVNKTYTDVTGKNVIEFLTSIELNGNSNNTNGIKKVSKEETIEDTLKNSMGNICFSDEKQRFLRYDDYRLIDSYIPELSKCLDLYRDCILSPDDITKKSLNYYYNDKSITDNNQNNIIQKNVRFLDEEYNISSDSKNNIRNALLDGDLFTIILDFNKEFSKIL